MSMSKIPKMMIFKCSNCCKIVFDQLMLSFNAVNMNLCKMPICYRATDKLRICVFYSYCKSKIQLFSKVCVSRTLDIFLIRNCEYLPSVSAVNGNSAFIKMSSQVKQILRSLHYAFLYWITPLSAIRMCIK